MVEMAAEKGEMVEDMYLDVNSVDNIGIDYWSAENASIGLSSSSKRSQLQNSQSTPQAYNLNLLPSNTPQDHSNWYP